MESVFGNIAVCSRSGNKLKIIIKSVSFHCELIFSEFNQAEIALFYFIFFNFILHRRNGNVYFIGVLQNAEHIYCD